MNKKYEQSTVWWNNLTVENLYYTLDCWSGYYNKRFPDSGGCYGLTDDQILYIYENEKANLPKYTVTIKDRDSEIIHKTSTFDFVADAYEFGSAISKAKGEYENAIEIKITCNK